MNEGRIDDLIQQVEQEMEGKEAAQSEIEATKKNLAASDRSVVHNLQRADNLQQRFDDNVLQLDEAKKTINDLTAALAAGSDSALAMAAALEVAQGSATGFSAPNTSKRQGAAAPAPQSKKPRTQANHPPGSAAAVATALRNDQARSERLKTTKGCYRCEWPGHRNLPDNRCDSTQVGPPANNKWRLGPKGEAGWKALKDDDPTKVKPLTAPQ